MTATASNYKATFILDTRGREESVDELIESLKANIAATGAEITKVENLGRKEFARVPDAKYDAGVYVQYYFSGDAKAPSAVLEKLRLNREITHKLIQKA